MGHFLGRRPPNAGACSKIFATMKLDILTRKHTGYRGDETKTQRETPSETPCPPLPLEFVFLGNRWKIDKWILTKAGCHISQFRGSQDQQKMREMLTENKDIAGAQYGTYF